MESPRSDGSGVGSGRRPGASGGSGLKKLFLRTGLVDPEGEKDLAMEQEIERMKQDAAMEIEEAMEEDPMEDVDNFDEELDVEQA